MNINPEIIDASTLRDESGKDWQTRRDAAVLALRGHLYEQMGGTFYDSFDALRKDLWHTNYVGLIVIPGTSTDKRVFVPAFQWDADTNEKRRIVTTVNLRVYMAANQHYIKFWGDPWTDTMIWWLTGNDALGGITPLELLDTEREHELGPLAAALMNRY